jgi:hypothetical protein
MLLAAGAVVNERRLSGLEVRARLLAQTARVAIPGLILAVSLALAPEGLPLLARFFKALGFDLAAEREPRNSILNSESRPRVLSLEHTELLPKSKDLKAQVAAGAEEDAEAADHADEERNHGIRCIP